MSYSLTAGNIYLRRSIIRVLINSSNVAKFVVQSRSVNEFNYSLLEQFGGHIDHPFEHPVRHCDATKPVLNVLKRNKRNSLRNPRVLSQPARKLKIHPATYGARATDTVQIVHATLLSEGRVVWTRVWAPSL